MLNFQSFTSCSIVLFAPLILEAVALGQLPNGSTDSSLPLTGTTESRIEPLDFNGGYPLNKHRKAVV